MTENLTEVGAFKTPTLRNIEITQPYMHDGSLASLEDVVDFYNNGGRVKEADPSIRISQWRYSLFEFDR